MHNETHATGRSETLLTLLGSARTLALLAAAGYLTPTLLACAAR